jgi:hypothetical protein
MAAKRISKAGEAARQIREHPIVGRLLEDAELRDSIQSAYESSRRAYARLNSSKAPTKALLDDKKLHKELQRTADALREVSDGLRKPKKRRHRLGKLIVITFVGSVAALALSEGLRSKVLDMLFGAEEEFDYTSTTSPATPPPAPEASTVEAPVPSSGTTEENDAIEADSEATATSS